MINGGDVTDYSWAEEYALYRRLHAPLEEAGIRQHFIPGNHDVRWSPRGPTAFTHQSVRFLLLDSTIQPSHYGHFKAKMLRWVERELPALPKTTSVLLFSHHWTR